MSLDRPHWLIRMAGFGLFLIPWQLLALDPARSVYQYNCRNWTRQTGAPVSGIRALAQTRDGYLWLGTQQGLVRFDGLEFQTFSLPSGPQFRRGPVVSLASSPEGGLWFGIEGSAFGLYDGTGFHSMERFQWVNPQMRVGALQQARDGWLWVGAGDGAGRGLGGRTNGSSFISQMGNVSAMCEDGQGRVWLGTAEQGLYYWQAGQIKPFPDRALAKKAIFALAFDARGWLWVGTESGVHGYDPGFDRHDLVTTSTEIKALLADRHGVVWIGTGGDGLIRYRDGEIENLHRGHGFAHDFVTALLEDREGNIWAATREGLSQLSDVKFPTFTSADGLGKGECHGLCASGNGGIWVALTQGISWLDGQRVTNFASAAGFVKSYVKRVFEARDGDLYFINANRTGDRQVGVLSQGKIVACYTATNWPIALAEDAQGVVAAVGGDLFRVSREKFVPMVYPAGKAPVMNWVRNLFGCADGSLLVATVEGVFRLKAGAFEHWSIADGLSDGDALWASEDSDGTMWVGLGTGLARIRGRQVRNIGQKDGLADSVIRAIVPDNEGHLWLHSSHGILRTSRQNLNDFADGKTKRVACDVYDGLESVKTIDTSSVECDGCKTADGRIWFPSPSGPVVINPAQVPRDSVAPAVHIERVRANGREESGRRIARVPPGRGELEVQYTGLSYVMPQKIRFRYKLEGYDADWIDAGARRTAFYTNLRPGKYNFRVQACNADGVWNRGGDNFEVALTPHFYETAWFGAAGSLLVMGLGLGAYGCHVKRLEQKQRTLQLANESLESKVHLRTSELAEQRNLLRTLIDHLPDNVFVKDRQSRVVIDNLAHAQSLGLPNPEAAVGKTDFDCLTREEAEKFFASEQELLEHGTEYNAEEKIVDVKNGKTRWLRTTKVAVRDTKNRIIGLAGINRDITERKKWEAELELLHRQLMEASRHAGMAEVATSVLHNVGNVLNSVNVSASVVAERMKNTEAQRLDRVLSLLREHETDLADFLSHHPRGRHLIAYLRAVAEQLRHERAEVLKETDHLRRNVEHIKEIVAMQQANAKTSGVVEVVRPAELIEDALRLHGGASTHHFVKVSRDYAEVPPIMVDRHKVLQILVNLLQNAQDACDANDPRDKQISVRLRGGAARVILEVADNGIGIPPENLTRIFSHGFTTRKNGHGFGLHSGALAAQELGGSLTVSSGGIGQGATFTLELPVDRRSGESGPVLDEEGTNPAGIRGRLREVSL